MDNKDVNKNVTQVANQVRLLKPQDLIDLETGNVPPTPEKAETVEKVEEKVEKPPEDVEIFEKSDSDKLDEIEQKLKEGKELTEEDLKEIDNIDEKIREADLEIEKATKTYVIGGKSYSQQEIESMMRKDKGLEDVPLSQTAISKLCDDYVAIQNKKEAARAIDRGYKENAEERKRLEIIKQQNELERKRLQAERESLKRRSELIKKQIEEANALLSIKLDKNDLRNEDGEIDIEKQTTYLKQQLVKEKLNNLLEEKKELEAREKENEVELINKIVDGFITAHAEYKTSEPIEILAQKFNSGQPISKEDKIKLLEIQDMLVEAERRGISIDDVHELRSLRNNLAIRKEAQASMVNDSELLDLPRGKELLIKKIEELKAKKRRAIGIGGSGGGVTDSQGPAKKSLAARLIENDRLITRGNKPKSKILEELGYK